MKTGIYKGKHKVKVHETKENGKTKYVVEFENGTTITTTDLSDVILD